MAFQPEVSVYDAGVFQWETTTPALGGVGGAANTPLLSLANRTKYLKDHVDALEAAASAYAGLNSPALTGSPTAPTQALGDASTKLATDAFVQNTVYSVVSLNVAGNANVNLTAVQAGAGSLKFTGALTGNISIVVPNTAKRWTLSNATSGNFTITVKTAAGAGVVVAQGYRTVLECDAVDVYDLKTDFPDAVLRGNPTTTTQAAGDNSTKVASTAFSQQVRTGYGTVNIAGNVNVNLTQAQWGLPLLTLSGALTGNIAVVVPQASSQWLLQNNATGGFVVTVRTAVGQGIDLTSAGGITQHLWCDGTDVHIVSGSFDTTYALVRKPTVIFPVASSTILGTAPLLQGNPYYSLYGVPQNGAQFQISAGGSFVAITWDSGNIGTTSQAQVPAGVLSANTAYYARLRYQDLDGVWSPWSDALSFTSGAQAVNQPSVTAPANGAVNIGDGYTFTSSVFSMQSGVDTHFSTDWEVWTGANGTGTRVFSSYGDTANKTSIAVPSGTWQTSQTLHPRVRYTSTSSGTSQWSNDISFTTANSFGTVLSAGGAYGGGYFGGYIMVGAQRYALIVSPAAQGVINGDLAGGNGINFLSRNDGWTNQQNYIARGQYSGGNDAIKFCKGLTIGGFTDWYLGGADEYEAIYRNLKPTTGTNDTTSGANANAYGGATGNYTSGNPAQTAVALFQSGGSEAFAVGQVKTSTYASASNNQVCEQQYGNGRQSTNGSGHNAYSRAIRRVPA